MRRVYETFFGSALSAAGVYALLQGVGPAWLQAGLIGLGGFFVSKSLVTDALLAAKDFWKR